MSAIARLCQRSLLIHEGKILKEGPSQEVIQFYLRQTVGLKASREWENVSQAPCDDFVRLRAVRVRRADGSVSETIGIDQDFFVEAEYEVLKSNLELVPNFHFFNEEGLCLFVAHDTDPEWRHKFRPQGKFMTSVKIPGNLLAEGTLVISVGISRYRPFHVHVHVPEVLAVNILDTFPETSARGDFTGRMPGVVRPTLDWRTQFLGK